MPNVIETNQLTRSFNSLTAVDKLDITVESGEIFGLLGPNGAGKTTPKGLVQQTSCQKDNAKKRQQPQYRVQCR